MIKLTIEIYPYGIAEQKRTIGEMFIVNDGTGTCEYGNYSYGIKKILEKAPCLSDDQWISIGCVKKHKRYEGIYELIRKILNKKECREKYLSAGDE